MDINSWVDDGQYFEYKNATLQHRIFYRFKDQKSDKTIVLIHGFPTFSWDWSRVWEMLPQEYNLLTLDMLGFGNSSKPQNYTYTIAEQSDIFFELLKKLQLHNVHILTHDYGVTVGQEMLDQKLQSSKNNLDWLKIHSMAFTNGGLFLDTYHPRTIQKLLLGPFGKFIAPFTTKQTLHKNFNAIFGKETQPTQKEIDTLFYYMSKDGGKKVLPNVIQYMKERKNNLDRWTAAMQKTEIPLRFINGAADPISGKHVAKKYLEIIPNPDVILLEKIGHYPNMEAPELVTKHYLNFLNNVQSLST